MIRNIDFSQYKDCLRHKAFDSRNATRLVNSSYDEDYAYSTIMDPFLLDVEKIRNSKSFRRLFYKTQVFPFPDSAYVRNRGFHTEDVVSIGTHLASILGLNVGLVQAGCYGHDLGQVPFGHLGEDFMSEKLGLKFLHALYGERPSGRFGRYLRRLEQVRGFHLRCLSA